MELQEKIRSTIILSKMYLYTFQASVPFLIIGSVMINNDTQIYVYVAATRKVKD